MLLVLSLPLFCSASSSSSLFIYSHPRLISHSHITKYWQLRYFWLATPTHSWAACWGTREREKETTTTLDRQRAAGDFFRLRTQNHHSCRSREHEQLTARKTLSLTDWSFLIFYKSLMIHIITICVWVDAWVICGLLINLLSTFTFLGAISRHSSTVLNASLSLRVYYCGVNTTHTQKLRAHKCTRYKCNMECF